MENNYETYPLTRVRGFFKICLNCNLKLHGQASIDFDITNQRQEG